MSKHTLLEKLRAAFDLLDTAVVIADHRSTFVRLNPDRASQIALLLSEAADTIEQLQKSGDDTNARPV